ncbi:MAG TPA: family 43 glycosylhydrolase [Sedimentisphaerales bacterium]|nr:family 43 glycosylhydrolase [Sedimentisphaerales bacterium]
MITKITALVILFFIFLIAGCSTAPQSPQITGEYFHIYSPAQDIFPGPDSENLTAGQTYDTWVPNDHGFAKAPDGIWHCFGITHPTTEKTEIHEAEWQMFHISSPAKSFADSTTRQWNEHKKILTPADRPNEIKNAHAPTIVKKDNLYYMFYGPVDIRYATSTDLINWTPKATAFTQKQGGTRDPSITKIKDTYYMVYISDDSLYIRTSTDLLNWSRQPTKIFTMPRKGAPESPTLIYKDNWYYLAWCIWDDTQGPYDHRTFIYASQTPYNFSNAKLVAQLNAHAPEFIKDENGNWFISSAQYPKTGINIAPLKWK